MLALWAEVNVVVADEFRHGDIPVPQTPQPVAERAFQALPESVAVRSTSEPPMTNRRRREGSTHQMLGQILGGFGILGGRFTQRRHVLAALTIHAHRGWVDIPCLPGRSPGPPSSSFQ
jgi:hypothetical protein